MNMPLLRVGVKILSQVSVIALIAGMAAGALYVVPSKLALLVTAIGLFIFEFHTGTAKTSSSVHFSAAVAIFFCIFYCIVFGLERPAREKLIAFSMITSAIWMIGRAGFLCGRFVLIKRLAAQSRKQKVQTSLPSE